MRNGKRGLLVILSAPSGCGKTTVMNRLLKRRPNLVRSISFTTRKPRKFEKGGKDYFFMEKRDFLQAKRKGSFLEWAKVFGHFYGTSNDFVLKQLLSGKDVVLTIDVQGAKKVRGKLPCASIFLMPPSLEDLKKRLVGRRTESRKSLALRLRKAQWEMKQARDYDYIVVNRRFEDSIRKLGEIIDKEKRKLSRTQRETAPKR